MDSMRSLNSSLPTSTPLSTKTQSPEQLLQAFKSAALSVTNLYKSAAASQTDARQQGYQDALEDLLVFLDKENLGLMDGEGWKVRQWATERYSRGPAGINVSDDEDDAEDDIRARSSSPVRPQNQNLHPRTRISSPAKEPSPGPSNVPSAIQTQQPQPQTQGPPPQQQQQQQHQEQEQEQPPQSLALPTNPPMFTFTAAPPAGIPLDTDMSASEVQSDDTDQQNDSTTSIRLSDPPVRLEVHSRGPRTPHRHSTSSRQRSGTREFRLNTGTKRKFPVPDFFNLSNFDNGNPRDPFGGGGKRGKFI